MCIAFTFSCYDIYTITPRIGLITSFCVWVLKIGTVGSLIIAIVQFVAPLGFVRFGLYIGIFFFRMQITALLVVFPILEAWRRRSTPWPWPRKQRQSVGIYHVHGTLSVETWYSHDCLCWGWRSQNDYWRVWADAGKPQQVISGNEGPFHGEHFLEEECLAMNSLQFSYHR